MSVSSMHTHAFIRRTPRLACAYSMYRSQQRSMHPSQCRLIGSMMCILGAGVSNIYCNLLFRGDSVSKISCMHLVSVDGVRHYIFGGRACPTQYAHAHEILREEHIHLSPNLCVRVVITARLHLSANVGAAADRVTREESKHRSFPFSTFRLRCLL